MVEPPIQEFDEDADREEELRSAHEGYVPVPDRDVHELSCCHLELLLSRSAIGWKVLSLFLEFILNMITNEVSVTHARRCLYIERQLPNCFPSFSLSGLLNGYLRSILLIAV